MKTTKTVIAIIAICVVGTSAYLTAQEAFCSCTPDNYSPDPANCPGCAQQSQGGKIFCNVGVSGNGCKSVSPAGYYMVASYNLTCVGIACVGPIVGKTTYTPTYACLQGSNPYCNDQ